MDISRSRGGGAPWFSLSHLYLSTLVIDIHLLLEETVRCGIYFLRTRFSDLQDQSGGASGPSSIRSQEFLNLETLLQLESRNCAEQVLRSIFWCDSLLIELCKSRSSGLVRRTNTNVATHVVYVDIHIGQIYCKLR